MANRKTNFQYHVPERLEEAVELLAEYGADAKIISGGTDLIPKIKAGVVCFDHLISLKMIDNLRSLEYEPGKGLTIGACVDLRTAEGDETVRKKYPALYEGMHSMANTQVRNRGTIVGNICNAIPSADTAPALMIYDAQVRICSERGSRTVPVREFFTGVCKTVLEPDEIVTEIFLPEPETGAFSTYYKYAIRKALDLAMIGVAVNVLADGQNVVQDVRIALGAVAATPVIAVRAQESLAGKELTEENILAAARIASEEDCRPISDIRATAEYRRRMVFIHTRDALRKAVR